MDLTIIIPVYNRREYLQTTLATIPESYPVILVDNGSTDGSLELCATLSRERGNTTVTSEATPGAAAARNRGLSLCKSQWVYFFDSDDFFTGLPTAWEAECQLVCFPTSQKVGRKICQRSYSPVATPHTHILNAMLNTQGMIFRTDFLRRIGGWNTQCIIWDDWELGLRALLNAPKLQWITEKTHHIIQVHPDSLTGADFSSRTDRILQTLDIAFNDICALAPQREQALSALFYRCCITSGKMLQEGNPEAAHQLRSFIHARFPNGPAMGRLFEWGTAKGIRGLWRIALWLINHGLSPHSSLL